MSAAMTLVERARWLAMNQTRAPETIRRALQKLELRPAVAMVDEHLPTILDPESEKRFLVLGGKTRVGKTVASYYAFALEQALHIQQALDRLRDDWQQYQTVTRLEILAEGEPTAPTEAEEAAAKAQNAMGLGPTWLYKLAKQRFDAAVRGKPEPDYEAHENQMLDKVEPNVLRAGDIIASAFGNKRWLDDLARQGRLLAVDDMGTEHLSDRGWGLSCWDDFIDYRHRHGLPTIVTTNLTTAQFRERYKSDFGDRIYQRLRELALWSEVDAK